MARISGVNIPTNKRIHVALTYIFGIGPKIAENICTEASIDISKRVNQLNDDEVNKIRKIIVPNTIVSRSQTLNILVNKEEKRLNGKVEK